MPIYGYACRNCGHTLDALQKMADDPLTDCPECEQPALKRQLSAPRFRLKGQGWYETDFKTGDKRNIAGEADAAGNGKDKATDKATDKPSDKAESGSGGGSGEQSGGKTGEASTAGSGTESKPARSAAKSSSAAADNTGG